MKFGIDSDGNYGYIKAGADTVTPFKSGGNIELVPNTSSSYTTTEKGKYLIIASCGTYMTRNDPVIFHNIHTNVIANVLYIIDESKNKYIVNVALTDELPSGTTIETTYSGALNGFYPVLIFKV